VNLALKLLTSWACSCRLRSTLASQQDEPRSWPSLAFRRSTEAAGGEHSALLRPDPQVSSTFLRRQLLRDGPGHRWAAYSKLTGEISPVRALPPAHLQRHPLHAPADSVLPRVTGRVAKSSSSSRSPWGSERISSSTCWIQQGRSARGEGPRAGERRAALPAARPMWRPVHACDGCMCIGSVGAGRPRAAQLTRVWGARVPSLCSPGRTVAAFVCMFAIDLVPGRVFVGMPWSVILGY
jgi:hypothetical protein